jgi:DNA-binding MarR family transcriptional regulator
MDNSGFSFESCCAASDEELVDSALPGSGSMSRRLERDTEFPAALVKLAKRIKAIRESRAALLDASLFGEPAWNILLALYIAAGERYALSMSALCAESGAPATTATRSINRMIELEMVRRVPNPSDNRSTYIELTRDTAAKLTELLDSARSKYLAD